MNRRVLTALGAALSLYLLAGCAAIRPVTVYQEGNVSITRTDYHGWKGCYRITNGTADVVVVPQIARVMQYGPAGQEGLLFLNGPLTPEAAGTGEPKEYPNYGGMKLWVAPERAWTWPPDRDLDRGPCTVKVQQDGSLLMTGTPSPKAGVRFDRVVRLDPQGVRLTIEQRMTNTSGAPVTWGIWDVTQVAADSTVVIPLGPDAKTLFDDGKPPIADWRRLAEAYVVGSPHASQKLFVSGGPDWLASRHGERLLLKSFTIQKAPPPQPETPREVWIGTDGFMELEFVGPEVTLQPGQTTTLTQEWRYCPLGADAGTDEGLVRAAYKAAASAGL
jgi:hypothetical protein